MAGFIRDGTNSTVLSGKTLAVYFDRITEMGAQSSPHNRIVKTAASHVRFDAHDKQLTSLATYLVDKLG